MPQAVTVIIFLSEQLHNFMERNSIVNHVHYYLKNVKKKKNTSS